MARRMIWEGFRNPMVSYVTLHRIDASGKKQSLADGFMDNLGWGRVRGLYPYAFIPDNPSTTSDKFESYRITLDEWLNN